MKKLFKTMAFTLLGLVLSSNLMAGVVDLPESLDLTGKSYSQSSYNTSTTYGDWTIVNGANNNKGWAYFKMGGKEATLATCNPCYIYYSADEGVSSQVDAITVHIVAGSLSATGMSVNSWGVYVYSDKAMTTQIDYVAGGTITKNAADFEFTPSEGKTWAKGYYYKVSWDLTNTTKNNGIVCVDKITLHKNVEGRVDPTVTFNEGSIKATKTLDLNTLYESDSDGDVTYEITEGSAFATIDGAILTGVAEGSVTVQATQAQTDAYNEKNTSATITILPPPTYTPFALVTDVANLEEGQKIIIVNKEANKVLGSQKTNNRDALDVVCENNKIMVEDGIGVQVITLDVAQKENDDNDYWTLGVGEGKYLYAASSSNNYLKTKETLDDNGKWSISINEDNEATILAQGESTHNLLQYTNTNGLFACYTGEQTAVKIFAEAVESDVTKATPITNGEIDALVNNVSIIDSKVSFGTVVTLTNTPADGYKLNTYDVYKTSDSDTKVAVAEDNGVYTFVMPSYAVTVSASFVNAKTLNDITITGTAADLWKGDEFSHEGITVTANYEEGDEDVTDKAVYTGYDMATPGVQTVTVTFAEGATEKSKTYQVEVKTIANTKETAYTAAQAIDIIVAGKDLATEVYVKGIVSRVVSTSLPTKGYLNYFVSADGTTTSPEFEFYQNYKGFEDSKLIPWSSFDELQIGAEVIGYGVMTKFGSEEPYTYEFEANNYLVSYIAPENPKTTATITLGTYKNTLSSDEAADEVTITYTGDGELSATSSNESAATAAIVNGKLVVTPVAAGSATITVSAPETDEYTAATKSYNLTVTAGLTAAALPFEFDGGKNDINPANGIKADGLANDYSASPKLKFDGEGDYVLVKINSKAVQLSYSIKGNPSTGDWSGQFDVLESANGTAYTIVASHTELATSAETMTHDLLEGTRYIKFVLTTKSNGNVALGAINIAATKPKVDPEFSIANVDVVVEETAELQINTNSTGTISYTIDPADEGKLEIEDDIVYAYEEGEYTVTANITATDEYNEATTTFKVTVSSVAYKTAEVTTFSAVNGGLLELGQFHSHQGESSTAPAVNGGQIRLYQKGGYITISALPGLKIAKIDIASAMATSYNYKVDDAEDYALTDAASLAANATANIAGLTADNVRIYCLGTDKNSRFYVSYLKVYYTGELETVSALAVDGATKTEYEIGETVDHAGAVVTATFENAGDVDVTLNSTFTDPDMSTSGTKQVTANFAEQTATYDITVKAETLEITVDATEVPFGTVAQNAEVAAKKVAVTLKAIAEATVAIDGEGKNAFTVTPATLTESGDITITPVTTAAGEFTATITISADGAESKTVTVTMNVTDGNLPKEKVDFTEVYSSLSGNETADFTEYNGATFSLVASKGEGSNAPKYYANGSAVRAYKDNTITISSSKTIAFILINHTGKSYQDVDATVDNGTLNVNEAYSMWTLDATSGTITLANTVRFDNITVFYEYDEVVRTAQSENQISTGCQTLDIVAVKGATLYQVNYTTGSYLEFMEVTYPVKAGMPIIMQADNTNDGKIEVIYGQKSPVATEGLDKDGLYGYIGASQFEIPNDEGYYVFKGGMLRPALDNYTTSGHAYIKLSEVPIENQQAASPAPRRVMSVSVEHGAPTGVEKIMMNKGVNKIMKNNQLFIIRDGKVFNAQGQLVK